jgi:hypothetical protein
MVQFASFSDAFLSFTGDANFTACFIVFPIKKLGCFMCGLLRTSDLNLVGLHTGYLSVMSKDHIAVVAFAGLPFPIC